MFTQKRIHTLLIKQISLTLLPILSVQNSLSTNQHVHVKLVVIDLEAAVRTDERISD